MEYLGDERFKAFVQNVVKNNVKSEDALYWGIQTAFTRAIDFLEYASALDVKNMNLEAMSHHEMGVLLLEYCQELWEQRKAERLEKKWAKKAQKVARRAAYADASEILVRARKDGTVSYRFETAMACMGLMAEYLRWLGVEGTKPVVLNVLNGLPFVKDERGQDTGQQYAIPVEEADNFSSCGYELFQLKTLWNASLGELWQVMDSCLPSAIGRAGYHRRLRAPLVPGGYLPSMRVRVQQLQVNGKKLGADGSGWYDPYHPEMRGLVEEYGPVGMQFTAFNATTGHFFKGIIYPKQGMNNGLREEHQAAIQFDHLQVKGRRKNEHKLLDKVDPVGDRDGPFMLDGVHVGIMKNKGTVGKVSGCFETLENIGPNPEYYPKGEGDPQYRRDRLRVGQLVSQLTIEAVDSIGQLGPHGLLARAVRDDLHLRRLGEFITLANSQGAGINPLSIDILKAKLRDSLMRRLWSPTNGAGVNGRYPMVVIDESLKPGTCVMSGVKPGTTIACWRFPTVLAQGLLTLKVVGGSNHHRVEGKVIQNLIFMHPHDITSCQQGDDDGDEVGFTTDPRVIELFSHKLDRGIYHIEPAGEKLNLDANSPEGKAYLRLPPMGPVGPMTIKRACLLAAGDLDMARAFSVLIQEAIDQAKRRVRITDPLKACNLDNWYRDENGEYHIHYKINGEYVTDNFLLEEGSSDNFDTEWVAEHIEEAYANAMVQAGCIRTVVENGKTVVKPDYPLGWRIQAVKVEFEDGRTGERRLSKAVSIDNWKSWREKQTSGAHNWVHIAHDIAMGRWGIWMKGFESSDVLEAKEVLYKVMERLGSPIVPLKVGWAEYAADLRKRAGIEAYGAAMKRVRTVKSTDGNINGPPDEQARLAKIDSIRASLELELSKLSAQELLTVWDKELTDTWWWPNGRGRTYGAAEDIPEGKKAYKANKPNYAFMAVCSNHSAIMRALGMEYTAACGWLDDKRIATYVKWIRAQPNPFHGLSEIIQKNTGHVRDVHDDNGRHIHLHECRECTERLKTALVRSIRSDRTAAEQAATKKLVSEMNKLPNAKASEPDKSESHESETAVGDPWG